MPTLADRSIAALRENHDDLAVRVSAFGPEDLDLQSGSAEWDVAQVLSHLGSGAEIMLANLNGAIAGEDPPGQDFNVTVWDRWNAMSQQEKADGWLESSERLVAALEALDEAARVDVRVQLSFLPFPADITLITGMRLNEAALHAWDVRVAFDDAATLPEAHADVLVDVLTGPLSFFLAYIGKADAVSAARVRVDTTDPERALGILIEDAVSLADVPEDPTAVLQAPTESFVRLLAGRLGASHTPASVSVTGNDLTLDDLRRVFPGT